MDKPLVLIAEDDPDLGEMIAIILRQQGLDVEVIQEGPAALERVIRAAPDMLILDMHLPHMSGQEILEGLRGRDHLSEMRTIIITADVVLARTNEFQADLVLLKPITYQQITELKEWLNENEEALKKL